MFLDNNRSKVDASKSFFIYVMISQQPGHLVNNCVAIKYIYIILYIYMHIYALWGWQKSNLLDFVIDRAGAEKATLALWASLSDNFCQHHVLYTWIHEVLSLYIYMYTHNIYIHMYIYIHMCIYIYIYIFIYACNQTKNHGPIIWVGAICVKPSWLGNSMLRLANINLILLQNACEHLSLSTWFSLSRSWGRPASRSRR